MFAAAQVQIQPWVVFTRGNLCSVVPRSTIVQLEHEPFTIDLAAMMIAMRSDFKADMAELSPTLESLVGILKAKGTVGRGHVRLDCFDRFFMAV